MASNYGAQILAQTNSQALAAHSSYTPFSAPAAPRPSATPPPVKSSLIHSIAQATLHNKIEHVVGSVAKSSAVSSYQAAKTLGRAGIVNPVRLGAAEVTHNTRAENNVGKSIVQNSPSKVLGAGLQTAALAVPGAGPAKIAGTGLKDVIAKAILSGAKLAPSGIIYGAGQGISSGQKPAKIFKTAVDTGLSAGVLGAGGSLLSDAISKAKTTPLSSANKTPEIKSTPIEVPKSPGQGSVQKANTPEAVSKTYFSNVPKATKDYQAHTMKEFGTKTPNIVSADSAKFIVRGGEKMNPSDAAPFHEEASKFAKDYYKKLLTDPATKDKPVLITGGGAGAGKTSGLSAIKSAKSLDDYAAVNDTNLTSVKSATDRIEPALSSGHKVDIVYTFRHPIDAFVNGQLPRAERTGRIVPIEQHVETHLGSLDTIKQVAEKYKDNPNVHIHVVDNSRGKGNQTEVPLDFLKDKVYDKGKVTKVLHDELHKAQISPEAHAAYSGIDSSESKGQNPQDQTSRPNSSSNSSLEQSNQKVGTSKVGASVQQKAVERGLKDTYGDSATYEKISIADQAKRAVELTDNPEELNKVISGEKPLPNGLRATALVKAVEDHPILGKDPELLNRLSKSNLVTESSQSAQELRLAAERNPDSVTARLKEVRAARIAAAEKKLKSSVAKAVNDTVKEAKAAIPRTKRQDWSQFIESIKC